MENTIDEDVPVVPPTIFPKIKVTPQSWEVSLVGSVRGEIWLLSPTGVNARVEAVNFAARVRAEMREHPLAVLADRPENGVHVCLLGSMVLKSGPKDEMSAFVIAFNRVASIEGPVVIDGPGWYKLRGPGFHKNPLVIGFYNTGAESKNGMTSPQWYSTKGDYSHNPVDLDIIRKATKGETLLLEFLETGKTIKAVNVQMNGAGNTMLVDYIPQMAKPIPDEADPVTEIDEDTTKIHTGTPDTPKAEAP